MESKTIYFEDLNIDDLFVIEGVIYSKCMDDCACVFLEAGPSFHINAYSKVDVHVTPKMLMEMTAKYEYKAMLIAALYKYRIICVNALSTKRVITSDDLDSLDRIGKTQIASEHWILLNSEAKTALLNDSHHFVRSCALLSEAGFKAL